MTLALLLAGANFAWSFEALLDRRWIWTAGYTLTGVYLLLCAGVFQ